MTSWNMRGVYSRRFRVKFVHWSWNRSLRSGDQDWVAGPEISTNPVAIIDNLAAKSIYISPGAILDFRSRTLNTLTTLKLSVQISRLDLRTQDCNYRRNLPIPSGSTNKRSMIRMCAARETSTPVPGFSRVVYWIHLLHSNQVYDLDARFGSPNVVSNFLQFFC